MIVCRNPRYMFQPTYFTYTFHIYIFSSKVQFNFLSAVVVLNLKVKLKILVEHVHRCLDRVPVSQSQCLHLVNENLITFPLEHRRFAIFYTSHVVGPDPFLPDCKTETENIHEKMFHTNNYVDEWKFFGYQCILFRFFFSDFL